MATSIVITDTNQIVNAECIVDGVNILSDVMGNAGIDRDERGFIVESEYEADWWIKWAANEETIYAAYLEADEEAREKYSKAISDWSHDMEVLHEVQAEALGVDIIF